MPPKGYYRAGVKSAYHGKGRKSKRKRQAMRHPLPTTPERITTSKGTPTTLAPAPRTQQVAPQYPYVFADLKRIGIIAGGILILLIILSLVL